MLWKIAVGGVVWGMVLSSRERFLSMRWALSCLLYHIYPSFSIGFTPFLNSHSQHKTPPRLNAVLPVPAYSPVKVANQSTDTSLHGPAPPIAGLPKNSTSGDVAFSPFRYQFSEQSLSGHQPISCPSM